MDETGSTREHPAHGHIPNTTHGLCQVRNVSLGLSFPLPSTFDLSVDSETNFRMCTKRGKLCCETSLLVGYLLLGACECPSQPATRRNIPDDGRHKTASLRKLTNFSNSVFYVSWLLFYVVFV